MLRDFLKEFLRGPCGLETAGVALSFDGKPFLLRARLSNLLADAEGLQKGLQLKGAAGLRPCIMHDNVLSLNSDLAHRAPGFVEISCSSSSQLHRSTIASIQERVDLVLEARVQCQRKVITQAARADVEKSAGLSVTSKGLLADRTLLESVVKAFTMDWVHCTLASGTLTVEVTLLLTATKISMKTLEMYFKRDWLFPAYMKNKSGSLYQVFTASRKSDERLKASCSELLGVYGILRHFVDTMLPPRPDISENVRSFYACCKVIDILQAIKHRGKTTREMANQLRTAVCEHLALHQTVYGTTHLIPKHHYLHDICDQAFRDPVLLDMFVVERLHQAVKPIAELTKNTRDYETSLLTRRIAWQRLSLNQLSYGVVRNGLVGESAQYAELGSVVTKSMFYNGLCISIGDVVRYGAEVGVVTACTTVAFQLSLVIDAYDFVRKVSSASSKWKRCTSAFLLTWPAADVVHVQTWYFDRTSDCLVILT